MASIGHSGSQTPQSIHSSGLIAKKLSQGRAPVIQDIIFASGYLRGKKSESKVIDTSEIVLSELFLRKMSEWESKTKVLSNAERTYLAEFAYGLKKVNDFHEKNIRRHMEKLIDNGFKV